MPYVGIAYLPTDVQPVFIVLAIAGIVWGAALGNVIRVDFIFFAIVTMFLLALVTFFVSSLYRGYVEFYDLRALFGYITPVVVLSYFHRARQLSGLQVARVIDAGLALVAVGFVLNIVGLTGFIQLFVSRAEVDLAASSRGLTSFFPEQSRISTQMIYFGLIYLMVGHLNVVRLAILVLFSLLSASGQLYIGLAFVSLAASAAYLLSLIRFRVFPVSFFFFLCGFLLVCSGLLYFAITQSDALIALGVPQRGIRAINMIWNLGFSYIGQDAGILYKISGALQGITTLLVYPVNFQVGAAYYMASDPAFSEQYLRLAAYLFGAEEVPYPRRSFSNFGGWLSDFGLLGLFAFFAVFVSVILRSYRLPTFKSCFVFLLVGFSLLLLFVFRTNSSDPTFWLVLALHGYFINCSSYFLDKRVHD